MEEDKYSDLVKKIELEELTTNISSESYAQLLSAYLYQNKLDDARCLHRRIPQAIKSDSKELEKLFVLLKHLSANNTADVFKNVDLPWSAGVKPIINDLIVKLREDIFELVGQAYISIFEKQLMDITQLSREQLKDACNALNWTYGTEDENVIIYPKPPELVPRSCATSEDLLLKLTNFVSFLEN